MYFLSLIRNIQRSKLCVLYFISITNAKAGHVHDMSLVDTWDNMKISYGLVTKIENSVLEVRQEDRYVLKLNKFTVDSDTILAEKNVPTKGDQVVIFYCPKENHAYVILFKDKN